MKTVKSPGSLNILPGHKKAQFSCQQNQTLDKYLNGPQKESIPCYKNKKNEKRRISV